MIVTNGMGRERQLWESSDRGKRSIKIKPARRSGGLWDFLKPQVSFQIKMK